MLLRILLVFFFLIACRANALEVSGLNKSETIKFILDWQQQHPQKKLDSITRGTERRPRYSEFILCGLPSPRPIRATFNTTNTANLSTVEVIQVEVIDFTYTNELLIANCVSGTRTERKTDLFGEYVDGCSLSGKCNSEDLTAVKRLFNRSEMVTLHRTQTPLCNLQYFVHDIQKVEDGLCLINLAGIFQEYKITLRYKTDDHTYRIGQRTGYYIPEAPIIQLNQSSLDELRAILVEGRFSQKEGVLRYITERFMQANPKAQRPSDVFAVFGGGAKKAPPIKHNTSLSDLETLLPLITELLPSNQTPAEGAPPIGSLGMHADEALSAAKANKDNAPFSRNKFRRYWKFEDMLKRAEYWNGKAPDTPKKTKSNNFDFEF